jgi:hypothetical protein
MVLFLQIKRLFLRRPDQTQGQTDKYGERACHATAPPREITTNLHGRKSQSIEILGNDRGDRV